MRDWYRPIPRVLYRPNLFMGCEREPIQTVLLAAATVGVMGVNVVAFLSAALIWFIGHAALAWAAKEDPDAIKIYKRSLRFKLRYRYNGGPVTIPADTTLAAIQARWARR